jgi:electron transport complex protein RnfB
VGLTVAISRGCAGCGACLLSCPVHALRPGFGPLGGPLVVVGELCTGCGECIEVCPVDAVLELPGASATGAAA